MPIGESLLVAEVGTLEESKNQQICTLTATKKLLRSYSPPPLRFVPRKSQRPLWRYGPSGRYPVSRRLRL